MGAALKSVQPIQITESSSPLINSAFPAFTAGFMLIYKATALTSGLFSPIFIALENNAPVAQLDRASVYETEGYRFDSRQVHFPFPPVKPH